MNYWTFNSFKGLSRDVLGFFLLSEWQFSLFYMSDEEYSVPLSLCFSLTAILWWTFSFVISLSYWDRASNYWLTEDWWEFLFLSKFFVAKTFDVFVCLKSFLLIERLFEYETEFFASIISFKNSSVFLSSPSSLCFVNSFRSAISLPSLYFISFENSFS